MNILWVKANKLLPVHSGGEIRSYQILRHLANRHRIFFISYYDGETDQRYDRALKEAFTEAVSFSTGRPTASSLRRGWQYVHHMPGRVPFAVKRFSSPVVEHAITACLSRNDIDVVVCDFLDAAINLPRFSGIPRVLFQHNVESEIWRRHANAEMNPVKRLLYKVEFGRMSHYEKAMVKQFDHTIAVSKSDKRLMDAWNDPDKISVIPTGVDLKEYFPESSFQTEKPLVMFVGAMDWEPNISAVEYFCGQVWPLVLAAVPQARFRIVGRNPGRRIKALVGKSIEIVGRVQSVVAHLREAAVVVVPITVGGGTRLKIYEAMAAGKPVVSTSVGAEGLEVNDGRDILLADDPASFAAAVVGLLRDPEQRYRLGDAAAIQAARFDWPVVAANFAQILETVCSRPDQTRRRSKASAPFDEFDTTKGRQPVQSQPSHPPVSQPDFRSVKPRGI